MDTTPLDKNRWLSFILSIFFVFFILSPAGIPLNQTYASDWKTIDDFKEAPLPGAVPRTQTQDEPGTCHGSIQIAAIEQGRPITAGEQIKIIVKISSNSHLVGRVDLLIGNQPPVSMSDNGNGLHTYFWQIPAGSSGPIPIWFSALARQGGDLLCSGDKEITIKEGFSISLSGPSTMIIGIEESYIARVTGGKPPYTYHWDISGQSSVTIPSPDKINVQKLVAKAGMALFNAALIVTDSEEEKRAAQHTVRVYEQQSLKMELEEPPIHLKVNQTTPWHVKVMDLSGERSNYRVEFDWGDDSKNSVRIVEPDYYSFLVRFVQKHNYKKPGKYSIKIRATKESGKAVVIATNVNVSVSSANIISFSGPESVKKGDEARFTVKMIPGSASEKPYRYDFDWGDDTAQVNSNEEQITVRHIFSVSKKYRVRVRVNDQVQQNYQFVADEAFANIRVVDEITPRVNLGDPGWKHAIDNPSPLLIKARADVIDTTKNFTDIQLKFKNPGPRSIGVTIVDVIRTGPNGVEENLGRIRCNIGLLYPKQTRHQRFRVFVEKDQAGQYHGKLRVLFKTYGNSNMKFDITTESHR